jgi:asparagine synthase (glutamine-hydrolysing)
MCGIAGLFDRTRALDDAGLQRAVRGMCDAIAHRGPDGEGFWTRADQGVALGHRRLAIVDLTATGFQPMASADGRWTIAFNGEFFNHNDLRTALRRDGVALRGTSDTEAFLETLARSGLEAALDRVVGMFAIALWDARDKRLLLVRDRLGVKPLYYSWDGRRLAFASELKALRTLPDRSWSLDDAAFGSYLRHGYVPAPASIYREARKLPPGSILEIRAEGEPVLSTYWDFRAAAVAGRARWDRPIIASEEIERLDRLLRDSVRIRMEADVPLGAFLSGGIDSSVVVALMQAQSAKPVRTFTIGFRERGYDEAQHAAQVARHLGTDHTEHYLEAEDAIALIPGLSHTWDEPFADPSQIPTALVSAMARRHVTVALSGDGGDETFAGYNRYAWIDNLTRFDGALGRVARRTAAGAIRCLSPEAWDGLARLLPEGRVPQRIGEKLHKTAALMALTDADDIYRRLVSQWPDPSRIAPRAGELRGTLWDTTFRDDFPEASARAQALDTLTYLPDDILAKVDRATMSVGLEGREPLLDHRVVEYAWTLPPSFKMADGRGKYPLRAVLERYVPRSLYDRPKMGFAIPIDAWLRGRLRDWAEALLTPTALAVGGMLDPAPIRALWAEHLSGRKNHQYALWVILMWQDWRARWSI